MEIVLGGESWAMTADFHTLCGIEKALSTPLLLLAEKIGEGAVTLEEMAIILSRCTSMPMDQAGEALIGEFGNALRAVAALLMEAIGGQEDSAMTRAELDAMREQFP